jgi:hypothetical protein
VKFHLLIKSCLNAKFRRVLIDNAVPHDNVSYSNWEEVKSVVPQSLILSPLLLLLYVNDLLKLASKDPYIVLFVDDASIIATNHNDKNLKSNK